MKEARDRKRVCRMELVAGLVSSSFTSLSIHSKQAYVFVALSLPKVGDPLTALMLVASSLEYHNYSKLILITLSPYLFTLTQME